MDRRPGLGRSLNRVVWWGCLGWWNEGQGDVEIPPVTNDASASSPLAHAALRPLRLSGYILFPTLLFTAHLGGGWSTWVTSNSESFVQLLAYSIAPFLILAGVYSRIRWVPLE